MENGTACGDDSHHSSLVDTNLILPESGGWVQMLFEKLSVLWFTSARSDTMKNYRAYRSKLLMGKHSRLKHYGLAVIACALGVALAGPFGRPILVPLACRYCEQSIWRHRTWTLGRRTLRHRFQLPCPAIPTLSIKPLIALLTIRSFCGGGPCDQPVSRDQEAG